MPSPKGDGIRRIARFSRVEWLAHPLLFREYIERNAGRNPPPTLVLASEEEEDETRQVEQGNEAPPCNVALRPSGSGLRARHPSNPPSATAVLQPVTCICDEVARQVWGRDEIVGVCLPVPLLERLVATHVSPRLMVELFRTKQDMAPLEDIIGSMCRRRSSLYGRKFWLDRLREGWVDTAERLSGDCPSPKGEGQSPGAAQRLNHMTLRLAVGEGDADLVRKLLAPLMATNRVGNGKSRQNVVDAAFGRWCPIPMRIPTVEMYALLEELLGPECMMLVVRDSGMSDKVLDHHLRHVDPACMLDGHLVAMIHQLAMRDETLIRRHMSTLMGCTFAVDPREIALTHTDLGAARALLEAFWCWDPEPITFIDNPRQAAFAIFPGYAEVYGSTERIPRGRLPNRVSFPEPILRALLEEGTLTEVPEGWKDAEPAGRRHPPDCPSPQGEGQHRLR